MALFQHPLQLFSLHHPDDWETRYQEENGGLTLVRPTEEGTSALCVTPMAAMTLNLPGPQGLAREVLQAAERLSVTLPSTEVAIEERDDVWIGSAEGAGAEGGPLGGMVIRLWVVRRGPVALYLTQLGPGTKQPAMREAADRVVASISFPDVAPPSAAEFEARVLEVLQNEYPQFDSSAAEGGGLRLENVDTGVATNITLENLYRTCLLHSESAGVIIREYLNQLLDSLSGGESYDSYDAVRGRLLPMLKTEEWVVEVSAQSELVSTEFAPGLRMCFTIDEPTRVAYVTAEMLARWDIPLERLQEVAQDNLAARSPNLSMAALPGPDGKHCALVVNTRDGYDTARLVLPGLREVFARELGSEYLVGMPNRDFLIAFATSEPEMMTSILRQIKQDFHKMSHPLTQTIYRVRNDIVEPTDL